MTDTTAYVRTRNRWHKVVLSDGQRFSVERCNLDDARLFGQQLDEPPADQPRCKWCFR